jgi:hypothetical protein
MLIATWHILKGMTPYRDLAPVQRTGSNPAKLTQNLVKRLEKLGFEVTIEHKNAA